MACDPHNGCRLSWIFSQLMTMTSVNRSVMVRRTQKTLTQNIYLQSFEELKRWFLEMIWLSCIFMQHVFHNLIIIIRILHRGNLRCDNWVPTVYLSVCARARRPSDNNKLLVVTQSQRVWHEPQTAQKEFSLVKAEFILSDKSAGVHFTINSNFQWRE